MTTAEQIAMEEYPNDPRWTSADDPHIVHQAMRREVFANGYRRGQQDARSLPHPPTSELVEAGNVMKESVRWLLKCVGSAGVPKSQMDMAIIRASEDVDAWDAALAHPKEVAPTVDRITSMLWEEFGLVHAKTEERIRERLTEILTK